MLPEDRKYSKEHEWISVDGDQGKIGITDYAQKQLGDVVYVELPEVGTKLEAMQVFGNDRVGQSRFRALLPRGGRGRRDQFDKVVDTPELVNSDPHGEAWLIVVKLERRLGSTR